ncbi:uncharacterized protein LOC413368 isoform X3 [Apis mellifera]|uniref:Uncharacterized protein LOC413368 isoform X3 n=1 Tax=Apis mellifera TaxID=7460 RepID=A0A7M7L608_APIME|nr:uncharacterized protein LOC413368 isoform X3 [Apis mellifera]|eukprot:XP_026296918.1 uncharacterized protein LOC413368 isoform X3 [Apis mellifera]
MSECLEFTSSMTGSTNSGPLQPQKDSSPLLARFSPFDLYSTPESPTLRGHRQRLSRKMTLTSSNGQPIQLTPLWEHVVRTKKFPTDVDTRSTFLEISDRLRDPEWEVRQHALRVLIDVLPTLNADIVDKVMQPVVPELVNNLGHPAPAVRKGALDAFRVFLIHSHDRENTIKNILEDGLNRSEVQNSFQTNVTTGVILSVPSLLFPSSNSPSPDSRLVKEVTIALASRLAQVPHQEAVLKSLMKIRDAIGVEEFESYLEDYDNKLKKNIEILSKIYNVKSNKKNLKKGTDGKNVEKVEKNLEGKWENDSDTSGIAEEEDEITSMPAARVVLETEIKFNEETAITMTILEEKDDSENEQNEEEENETDIKNEIEGKEDLDKRKTPRRVHFGGEIVKLRTPDSDDTESGETTLKTKIPLPVSPVTKMPINRLRPSSQPCSPHRELSGKYRRTSRSVSNSPKREIYTHNAELSPKKSILTRTSSPFLFSNNTVDETRKKKSINRQEDKDNIFNIESSANDKNMKIEIGGKVEKIKKEEVQNSQNNNAINPNIKINHSENVSLIIETSKNDSKVESDNLGMQNKIIDIKDISKDSLENKISENIQKNNMEKTNESLEINQKVDSFFGSVVKNEIELKYVKINQDGVIPKDVKLKNDKMNSSRNDNSDYVLKSVCEQISEYDEESENIRKNKNTTFRSDKMEFVSEEPNWEELGLVDHEVLEDLHNKDDWRARVRGLERVASALRTSSALIAIEPRLGSLLHAVLGCERSCRVAAAGLAVAKVVVVGVSEEALRKRLPQLAWGLARHGGPSAAQLARIAMLRLRPALLLEQLLQPQCLNARNAKTRENCLQLLIFSLITFPSTEFKVDIVANKVAKMMRDRRRRVRQAALDTLAVLAQIYESEEILAAGKRASEGYHDGEAMMSAIRARLARKSLPLVSADGLVIYGLQISPTVQIATGPDVDWIVAGSGSISPAIGRTKGQFITTRSNKEKLARNENTNYRENLWNEKPNFVALGVGMRSKTEQPVVWQIIPSQNQNTLCEDELNFQTNRNINTSICSGNAFNSNIKFRNQTRNLGTARESANYRNIIESNFEKGENNKIESRIPVFYTRENTPKSTEHNFLVDKSSNLELINVNLKKKSKNSMENSSNRGTSQEENIRSCGAMYQRRKNKQENSTSMHYDNYRSMKNLNNTNVDCNTNNVDEHTNQIVLDSNSRFYQKFMERDRHSRKSDIKSKYVRSSSIESHQPSRNDHQSQTFIMYNMYNTPLHRKGRFVDENSFRPLQKTPPYSKIDFIRTGENNDTNLSYMKSYRKTKDAAAQKVTDVELISSDAQTSEYFPAISTETPYRRRLRSLSPSQLYHRQQFRTTNEIHALSMYDIDKAVKEEEHNEKNKHYFLPDDHFGRKTLNVAQTQYEENNDHQDNEQDVQNIQDDSDFRSSTPERQNVDTAFNIITGQISPPGRDFIVSLDKKVETEIEVRNISVNDDRSRDWNSDEEFKDRYRTISRNSEYVEYFEENQNDNEVSISDEIEKIEVISVLANKNLQSDSENEEILISKKSASSQKSNRSPSRNSVNFETSKSSRCNSRNSSHKSTFEFEDNDSIDLNKNKAISSTIQHDIIQSEELNQSRRESKSEESPAIIIASRPHSSTEISNYIENRLETSTQIEVNDNLRFFNEPNENNDLENGQNKDSSSETNTDPGILKIETQSVEPGPTTKRKPSRVPRISVRSRGRSKGNLEKIKPIVQQCFVQLENKDWEIIMKALKTLSQIAKQQPEYLDICAASTINRLVARQIKSLRSQVARTACLAAGDIFSSQIRGIDQEFDDIAGSLLHRTADTNRFLRSDSNAALDRMIEHLPPHKTITVIVQCGASHQNAIVRAATARLLASIVDRIGPEHTLILPKDVRDKLLSTGARLLIDGNLDARNHAKKMFRKLTHCEGFRKALTDAVPETTLRHIDKTLKAL